MKIKIYQISPVRDRKHTRFMSYAAICKMLGTRVLDGSVYDVVFDGEVPCKGLEDVYAMFNLHHPVNFTGHSLSVSDVVQVEDNDTIKPGFYFCDSFGFVEVELSGGVDVYNVSFIKNGVGQARLVQAESIEQAGAYFQSIEPTAKFLGVKRNNEGYKPGKPMEIVGKGWKPTIDLNELRSKYPKGTQVKLIHMEGEWRMPSGLRGRVVCVDDAGQVHVNWENGSVLALNLNVDSFDVVDKS